MLMPDRRLVLATIGVAVALALLALRWYLVHGTATEAAASSQRCRRVVAPLAVPHRDADLVVGIHPIGLGPPPSPDARAAVRHRDRSEAESKNPKAFHATGRMLFGDELWAWVDPENIARTDSTCRARGGRRSTTSFDGWSKYDALNAGGDDHRPL